MSIPISAHQTHYEQMGEAKGTVTINGKLYPFNIDSMRDHSYGKTIARVDGNKIVTLLRKQATDVNGNYCTATDFIR